LQEELENMLGSGNDRNASHGGDKDNVDADAHPNNSDKKDKKRTARGDRKKTSNTVASRPGRRLGPLEDARSKNSPLSWSRTNNPANGRRGPLIHTQSQKTYLPISLAARAIARERAVNNKVIVKKLMEQEQLCAKKKCNWAVYQKSKAALKKTAKSASHLVTGTGKIAKKMGKVGMIIGKRGVKASVATATLDPRILKEALKIWVAGNKKR